MKLDIDKFMSDVVLGHGRQVTGITRAHRWDDEWPDNLARVRAAGILSAQRIDEVMAHAAVPYPDRVARLEDEHAAMMAGLTEAQAVMLVERCWAAGVSVTYPLAAISNFNATRDDLGARMGSIMRDLITEMSPIIADLVATMRPPRRGKTRRSRMARGNRKRCRDRVDARRNAGRPDEVSPE